MALKFFQKCLDASQRSDNKESESKCYQQIGHIQEKLGDLDSAIQYLQKFLSICEET